ncbi:MAG: hypothetical protein ACOY3P_00970, partial [Planctomycetota bacterium]
MRMRRLQVLRQTEGFVRLIGCGVPRGRRAVQGFAAAPLLAMLLLAGPGMADALAGGGPENVLLVVNRDSADSLAIANHFIALRQIPPGNVLTIPWEAERETASFDEFREKLLKPILNAIEQRRLLPQIDYVVYSCDFPTRINLHPEFDAFKTQLKDQLEAKRKAGERVPEKAGEWPMYLTPIGSLTGLTYLWQATLPGSPAYLDLQSNKYFRAPKAGDVETRAFQSTQDFDADGQPIDVIGRRYLLSVMLGVTRGRGNTPDQVLDYLRRAASADGTFPPGTIYFCRNSNIRSQVRQGNFSAAVDALTKLNVKGEIFDGVLPKGKNDVQGLVTGTADFDWSSSKSTILPGAICENFTSYGGMLQSGAGQTPLTEFLRFGAAGSSGTVVEPYSLPHKFPTAFIQVHYARGSSLAEAFYQSVSGPFQLLIVGDPLCQPWANIPRVTVDSIKPGATLQGTIEIRPSATLPREGEIERFELFVEEQRQAECLPDGTLKYDTAQLGDGHHELRVVAVAKGPAASQGRAIIPVVTANHGRTIETELIAAGSLS